jgi:internalin A
MDQQNPYRIYISCAPADIAYKKEIVRVLENMSEPIEVANSMYIYSKENSRQLAAAQPHLYIVLVSANYMSLTGLGNEISVIHTQYFLNQRKIVAIILEPCDWKKDLRDYTIMPQDGRPVSEFKDRQAAYNEIAQHLSNNIRSDQNRKWIDIIHQEMKARFGVLELDNFGLKKIPYDLEFMPWLTKLSLANNEIATIEYLKPLRALRQLNLSHNRIEGIRELNTMKNLRHLDISHNRLRSIGYLRPLVHLTTLELHHNQITRISNLDNNTALKTLGLSNNKITKLENIGHLKELQALYASYNEISDLSELAKLPKLNRIVLSSNKIESLKPLLPKIQKGLPVALNYSFDVEENGLFIKDNTTLSEPSVEVIESGHDAIIKYFTDAGKHGTEQLEIVKLILVGNSRVGKTNFSEFLRHKNITEASKSTHVLDIQLWDAPDFTSASNTPVRVNIFDFGGQDYYHDSHRMYYTHDTAYVLLWDATSNKYSEEIEESEERITYENYPLEYWLESINYNLGVKPAGDPGVNGSPAAIAAGKVPVLIIQNKIDVSEGALDQKGLSAQYNNIWGYFNMSLAKNKRTSIVYEVLKDYMGALNLTGRTLIKFEMDIITSYFARQEPLRVVSLEDFRKECIQVINNADIEFNRDNAVIVAQILHNTGLLFYDKHDGADGKVYTNIRELNDIIKRIMDTAKKGNDKGIFSRAQIDDIPYKAEVLAMLTRNNSIIEINNDDFLVPQFLPVKPDPSVELFLPAFSHCQMRFVYKAYFHKSLLLNLFAKYLKNRNIDTSAGIKSFQFWRNGIIVSKETNSKELVFVEFMKTPECGMVNIRTMAPFNRNGLEKEIEDTLDALSKDWTHDKEISTNSSEFFSVKYLTQQIEETQYVFTKNKKSFTINDFKDLARFEKLPKKLFISYSSKNADFIRRFVTHLEVLKSAGLIEPWYDRMIESGTRWDDTIRMEMKRSDVIIFLLSPDFIATEYVMKTEIPQAIEQMENNEARFFFVQLLPCAWERTILSRYQQTDNPAEPGKNIITIMTPDNDLAWNHVINELAAKLKV